MSVFKKIAEKLDNVSDKGIAEVVERAGIPPKPEPSPRPSPKPDEAKFVRGLGQRIGIAGIAVLTIGAALFGAVACKVPGQPEPRPPYTEDADKPDYRCGYDGNQRCPTTPPPVHASCDEPASWCHRGDTAEAVQR